MAAGWQRTGAMASGNVVARPSQPSAFPHRPYSADPPAFATASRRWHPWETSPPQGNASHRNEAANPPHRNVVQGDLLASPHRQRTISSVYNGAGSPVRTEAHVVHVDRGTGPFSVSREEFFSNQRLREPVPVAFFAGSEGTRGNTWRREEHSSVSREALSSNQHLREPVPVRFFGGTRGDLWRNEDHAHSPVTTDGYRDPRARSQLPLAPADLSPPKLHSRTPEEDVFDASISFIWLVALAVNIGVTAVVIVIFAAQGRLGTAVLIFVAKMACASRWSSSRTYP